MRIEIEIPKEFEGDYNASKFKDFFGRVIADATYNDGLCGLYELETAQILQKAFAESKIAYDVEAVVAELEEMKCYESGCLGVSCDKCKYNESCLEGEEAFKVALDNAIEVVRNGGKE